MPNKAHSPEAGPSLASALVDAAPVPTLLLDGQLRVLQVSRSFGQAFRIRPDQSAGRTLGELGKGEWDIPQLRLLLENALLEGPDLGDYETDFVQKGGVTRRLVLNVQNVACGDAQDARICLTVHDVTHERLAARTQVTLLLEKDQLLRERGVMLQEMQHRIANSLQIIASVLLMKARTVSSDETKLHLRDAHDRVLSIAAVQQHLQFNAGDVEVGPYLTKLCESLSASMIRESRPLALAVNADQVTVNSHEAVSLGLVVTELVINALKHAFPGARSGLVTVEYRLDPDGWTLSVSDNGVGRPADAPPVAAGLGTNIIQALAKQLGARVVISDASPGSRTTLANRRGASLASSASAGATGLVRTVSG